MGQAMCEMCVTETLIPMFLGDEEFKEREDISDNTGLSTQAFWCDLRLREDIELGAHAGASERRRRAPDVQVASDTSATFVLQLACKEN